MALKFSRVALVGRYQVPANAESAEAARTLIIRVGEFLQDHGCQVFLHERTAEQAHIDDFQIVTTAQIGSDCDLCVVVGGDGSMLSVSRQLARYGTPLIGINQGRLGFITDIPLEDYRTVLPEMLAGSYIEDRRAPMLGRIVRNGQCVFEAPAMNDVVVNRGATSGMVELRVAIDEQLVALYRADGIIVSTATGSTAYSLSAGGPLLHPTLAGWSLVPISPHTLSNRPIVLPTPTNITIEIVGGREANASFDMQSKTLLQHGDRIEVGCSRHRAVFLHPKGWSYFDTLRQKLHWNKETG